jgi:Pentapeptide repeats (9 copies)
VSKPLAAPTPTATVTVTTTTQPSQSSTSGGGDWLSDTGPWLLVAAILALVGVIYTQRKQGRLARQSDERTQESLRLTQESLEASRREAADAAARAEADALAKRYQEAAAQLGHEKAPVRLAGVYAMARLADDWLEQRQECVDVLCAYLRMPSDAEGDVFPSGEQQVRATITAMIARHCIDVSRHDSWANLRFDLAGAALDNLNFSDVNFQSKPIFRNARFTGICRFDRASFEAGADFSNCLVGAEAILNLENAYLVDGRIDFREADLEAKSSTPVRMHIGRSSFFDAHRVTVNGTLVIEVLLSIEQQGTIDFMYSHIGANGWIRLVRAPTIYDDQGRIRLEPQDGKEVAGVLLEVSADPGATIFVDERLVNDHTLFFPNRGWEAGVDVAVGHSDDSVALPRRQLDWWTLPPHSRR